MPARGRADEQRWRRIRGEWNRRPAGRERDSCDHATGCAVRRGVGDADEAPLRANADARRSRHASERRFASVRRGHQRRRGDWLARGDAALECRDALEIRLTRVMPRRGACWRLELHRRAAHGPRRGARRHGAGRGRLAGRIDPRVGAGSRRALPRAWPAAHEPGARRRGPRARPEGAPTRHLAPGRDCRKNRGVRPTRPRCRRRARRRGRLETSADHPLGDR